MVEQERALKTLIARAMFQDDGQTPRDVLVDFAPLRRYQHGDFAAKVDFYAGATLPPSLLRSCFDLLKSNMQALYEATEGWGWKDKTKLAELTDPEARFLVATKAAPSATGEPPAPGDRPTHAGAPPVGAQSTLVSVGEGIESEAVGVAGVEDVCAFVHFRFCVEEDLRPVLYVWEIQVGPTARRNGLGKWLAQVSRVVRWSVRVRVDGLVELLLAHLLVVGSLACSQ